MAVAAMYRGRAMLAPTSFIKNNGAAAKLQLRRIYYLLFFIYYL